MINKKPISSICQIIGGNPSPKENEFDPEGVPFVKMKDLGRYHLTNNLTEVDFKVPSSYPKFNSLKRIMKGAILLPRSGSVALNHRAILGIDAFIVSHICALRVLNKMEVSNQYLYYYLTSIDMIGITKKTTGLDAITFEDLRKIEIPIPSLETQKKIAAILDKADELRRNDQKILEKQDQLARSVFLEMFGDPVTNPKGWEKSKLKNIGEIITGNTPSRNIMEYYGNYIEWIKTDNINTPHLYLTKAEEYL